MSHKLPWAQGRRARPVLAQYSENRAFRHETVAAAGYNLSLFQWVTRQIRYLADQWKINGILSPINEFGRVNNRITMEGRYCTIIAIIGQSFRFPLYPASVSLRGQDGDRDEG